MTGLLDHVLAVLGGRVRAGGRSQTGFPQGFLICAADFGSASMTTAPTFSCPLSTTIRCHASSLRSDKIFTLHIRRTSTSLGELAVLHPQAGISGICDAPAKEGAIEFLLHHGKEQPCDMLRVLQFVFGGFHNSDGIRLIVIAGKRTDRRRPALTSCRCRRLRRMVCDRAAAVFDEMPCDFLAVHQLIHAFAAAVQVHVVVAADSGEVGKVCNDRGLLAAEGQVDEILQLKKLPACGPSPETARPRPLSKLSSRLAR